MPEQSSPHSSPAAQAVAAASGLRMPAEWEPHAATWIAWPHNDDDWPGKMQAVQWVYGEIVRHLVHGERVNVLAHSPEVQREGEQILERVGVAAQRVQWVSCPNNRGWMRDTGPIFVGQGGSVDLAVARFRFNGWARYADWQHDDAIAPHVAQRLDMPLVHARVGEREVVLEGGAFDVNGCGTLVTTEECLLDPNVQVRNPGLSRQDYESTFAKMLGVRHVIWLGRGIAGDDTHGHVDDLCRFVAPSTLVLCSETDGADINYRPLAENRERLQSARLANGGRPEVVLLPMPRPLRLDGVRLPASYANFYASNAAVLVPTFNDPSDRAALGILSELFADRAVIGIHAVDLLWGLGAIHCLTQQQPTMDSLGSDLADLHPRIPGNAVKPRHVC